MEDRKLNVEKTMKAMVNSGNKNINLMMGAYKELKDLANKHNISISGGAIKEAEPVKKARGRPKKEVVVVEKKVEVEKKPRGRPKKVMIDIEEEKEIVPQAMKLTKTRKTKPKIEKTKPQKPKNEKIFWGIDPLPSDTKRTKFRYPTMPEALEKNKIGYWGLHKVDSRIVNSRKTGTPKELKAKQQEIIIKISGLKGTVTRLTKLIPSEKDSDKKIEMTTELDNKKEELKKLINEHKTITSKLEKLTKKE